MGVKFTNHSKEILSALTRQERAALSALGTEAVGMVVEQMRSGYHTPHVTRDQQGKPIEGATHTEIRWRGQLMGSINWQMVDGKRVQVGIAVEYAPYVHEGTRKLESRPFIKDSGRRTDGIALYSKGSSLGGTGRRDAAS